MASYVNFSNQNFDLHWHYKHLIAEGFNDFLHII